jgi:hypothetical protein
MTAPDQPQPALSADYVAEPMGANGHRWLARSVPGARHQIAVTGLTEAEARANFEAAWLGWNDLHRADALKPSMPYCSVCDEYGHYPSQHSPGSL